MRPKDRDLISLIENSVAHNAEKPIYSFLDRNGDITTTLSHIALYEEALALAALLQSFGLKERILVLLFPHGAEFIIAFYGAILAGAIPVPVTRQRRGDWNAIAGIIKHSAAMAVLTVRALAQHMPASLQQNKSLRVICTDALEDSPLRWERPFPRAGDPAFVQYTSGSTSRPRGVLVSHRNVLRNSEQIKAAFNIGKQDTTVSWLPFHHDMGLIGHIVQPLYSGMHNYFIAPRDFAALPIRWLQAISRYGATISGGPEFAYALCSTHTCAQDRLALDLSRWRLAYCGSERVLHATLTRFSQLFATAGFSKRAWYPCYGMAEATLFVCGRSGLHCEDRGAAGTDVSIGIIDPTDSCEVRIVDPVLHCEKREGEEGEIWVRSPSVASAYRNDEAASADVFGFQLAGKGPYLRTGDIGYVYKNNLYFSGRLKNLIKRRGRSFHCEDIEAAALSLLAAMGVTRSAAFDVETDAGPALVVLLEHDGVSDPALIEAQIPVLQAALCDWPGVIASRVLLLPKRALPLTSSGKLRRGKCRALLLEGALDHA